MKIFFQNFQIFFLKNIILKVMQKLFSENLLEVLLLMYCNNLFAEFCPMDIEKKNFSWFLKMFLQNFF